MCGARYASALLFLLSNPCIFPHAFFGVCFSWQQQQRKVPTANRNYTTMCNFVANRKRDNKKSGKCRMRSDLTAVRWHSSLWSLNLLFLFGVSFHLHLLTSIYIFLLVLKQIFCLFCTPFSLFVSCCFFLSNAQTFLYFSPKFYNTICDVRFKFRD